MKSFFVAMLLGGTLYAVQALAGDVYVSEFLGTGSEPDEEGYCGIDECSEGGLCYYASDANDNSCSSYCSDNYGYDATSVWDGDDLVCGCYLDPWDEWRASGTGQERKYIITPTDCDGGQTSATTNEYRCTAGYYGNGNTCTRCPGVKNSGDTIVYGNSPVGATSITQCTLSAGTYRDATGTFTLNGSCTYN